MLWKLVFFLQEILLLKFAQELEEYGVLEKMPDIQGKKMIIIINQKKK